MEAIVFFFFFTVWWLLCGQLLKGSLWDCMIIIGVFKIEYSSRSLLLHKGSC